MKYILPTFFWEIHIENNLNKKKRMLKILIIYYSDIFMITDIV